MRCSTSRAGGTTAVWPAFASMPWTRSSKIPSLHDNPVLPGKNAYGDPNMENKYNFNLPEVHDVLKGLRKIADKYDAVLIGETATQNIEQLEQFYGSHNDELQMPMDFLFTDIDKLSPPAFRKQIAAVNATGDWPVYVIGNHDRDALTLATATASTTTRSPR